MCDPELAEAFRLAKRHLWDGKVQAKRLQEGRFRFICTALDGVCRHDKVPLPTASKAKAIIMGRLDGSNSLEVWLYKQFKRTDGVSLRENPVKMQATRLAWLDSLIKEFS